MKRLMANAFLLLTFLFVSVSVNAQYKDLKEHIPLNPKVKTGTLDNGMKYYILENKKPENRAEVWIKFDVGSVQEEEHQRGLAHFIEHMCFNGTKNFPKDSLIRFLESTGIKFGADINAATGFDMIQYTLTVPTDIPGMLEKGVQVLNDWARFVSFDEDEIEKERGVILAEEITRMANAQGRANNYHIPKMLMGSKYAERMPIGLTKVIETAPKQAFLEYYYDWFRPELTAVVMVGDFETKTAEDLIKKYFADWKFQGTGTPKPLVKEKVPFNKEPIISIYRDKELSNAMAGFIIKHPERDNLSYYSYRENLKEQMFGIMFNMRMQEISQEANPPFLYAAGGMSEFIGGVRAFQLISIPKEGEFDLGVSRVLDEAFRVDQHGFTKSELERAKEQILSIYEKMFNERDKSESNSFARELTSYFSKGESAPGIEVEFDLVKKWLPEITLEEVNKMVSQQIGRENVVAQVSIPEDFADQPTEKSVMDLFTKSETTKHDPYIDDLGDAELMKTKPKAGKITSEKKLKNADVTEMILSNGARVLLKPTDFKNDEILFSCYSGGGASLYPDNEYHLVNSSDGIVDNCGLGEFSSTKLQKLLQSKMIRLSPYIADYEQGMRGSLTPKDSEIFFQLLHMQFTEPRKDNDAYSSWLAKTDEIIRNRRNDPMSDYRDTLNAVLTSNNIRGETLNRDHLEKFNLDRAYTIYQERFADASNFTFVFVGAFKIDEFKPLVEQYLASLPATKKAEKGKDLGIKPLPGVVNKVVKRGIEPKSTVSINIDFPYDNFSSEENLKINLLSEVLNIKIRETLREDMGGVYSPYARLNWGYFPRKYVRAMVYFTCDPVKTDDLVAAAKEVITNVRKEISNEDLIKAKELNKKENEVSVKENNYWLRNIVVYETTGRGNEGMAFLNNYAANIDKVTANDLLKLAVKYLDFEKNCISVIQMPEDDDD
ncbi:MAG: insulinase family protein [Bacteroidetes bacterium]|nr:insulinase family protein [Bacteroidota bacterium]